MTTAKAGPGSSVACPWITSILRILIRPVSPRTSLSTTFFWNASTPSQSGSPDALIPHSWDRFTLSRTAADWSRAFVGMQPRSRHVPPRRSSRSMSATRLPSSAARRAHAYPPVPAPRIATSYGVSATQPSYRRRDVPIRRARNRLRVRFPRGRRRGETDAARGRASRPRREDGAVRGMAHAHRVPRHAGRARGGPGAGRPVRPHAPREGDAVRPGGPGHPPARGHERRGEGRRRAGPVQHRAERAGRDRGRPHRVSAGGGAVLRRAERREHHEGPRDPAGGGRGLRRGPARGLVLPRGAGAALGGGGVVAVPPGGWAGIHALHGGRARRPDRDPDPLRLHGGGRVRAVPAGGRRAPAV